MSDQITATKDLMLAVEKSMNDLEGQGAAYDAIRGRLKETYVKLQGLLAMLEQDGETA